MNFNDSMNMIAENARTLSILDAKKRIIASLEDKSDQIEAMARTGHTSFMLVVLNNHLAEDIKAAVDIVQGTHGFLFHQLSAYVFIDWSNKSDD